MIEPSPLVSHCDHCGLPLPVRSVVNHDSSDAKQYCCIGCRIAASLVPSDDDSAAVTWTLTRLGLGVFFAMNVMVFTLVLWTQDVYDSVDEQATASTLLDLFRYLSLLFTIPVLGLLGQPLLEESLAALRARRVTTDVLLTIGVAASFVYSLYSVLTGEGHVYFEVTCMVLVAVTLGRWFEATGKVQTTRALRSLEKLLPDRVRRINAEGPEWLAASELAVGDVVRVLAGERIPADGTVVSGCASVDQQVVTGESHPLTCEAGDHALAGSLNLDGQLDIRTVCPPGETAIDRLVQTVSAAAADKEAWGRLADRVTTWFFPIVAATSLGTLIWNWQQGDLGRGILSSLAVIVIACPCALALATPLAIWAAFGRAARQGIVMRNSQAMNLLSRATTICFDKTGTITTGNPRVCGFRAAADERDEALAVASSLAVLSNHVISKAISTYTDDLQPQPIAQLKSEPGKGVIGYRVSDRERVYLGNLRYLAEESLELPVQLQEFVDAAHERGSSLTAVGWAGVVRGVFVIDEQLRPEAPDVIRWLVRHGRTVQILTGDDRRRANELADVLGVPVASEQLPHEKLAEIDRLRSAGPVAMIGDGLNDAPALAHADVGIAMGCGADISRQSADVCLLSNDLQDVIRLIHLSSETVRTIRWNLGWSLGYNLIALPIAALGWLNPIIAAVLMAVSSFLVVGNSLRLTADPEQQGQRGDDPTTFPPDDTESFGRYDGINRDREIPDRSQSRVYA